MAEFQFDTSGEVRVYTNAGEPDGARKRDYRWRDLSPFMQGYVEAMFESTGWRIVPGTGGPDRIGRDRLGFSDLAPETLARIMEDCERAAALKHGDGTPVYIDGERGGRAFWEDQQADIMRNFPPLTPYLGDDGKVYLRESIR